MAINTPYIPGDPYSYDLKWLVAKTKTNETAVAAAQAAADDANTTAGNAVTTANTALAAAQTAGLEVIEIIGDDSGNSAVIDTDYTWNELYAKVAENKVMFVLLDSNDSSTYHPGPVFASILDGSNPDDPALNGTIQVDTVRPPFNGDQAITQLYVRRAHFINSTTGYYHTAHL